MVRSDQPHVPAANDEQPIRRADEIAVDECLERPGSVDPRQRVPRKRQGLLAGAGRHEEHLRLDENVATVSEYPNATVAEHGESGAPPPNLHGWKRLNLTGHKSGDVDPARPRMDGGSRAEESMGLQHQLAAEVLLVIDKESVHAVSAQLHRCRHPRRASTENENGDRDRLDVVEWRNAIRGGKRRQILQRHDVQSGPHRRHARLDRDTISEDEALSALAVGAEDSLGSPIARVLAERANAVSEQGGGNRLSIMCDELTPLPVQGNLPRGHRSKDRMLFDPPLARCVRHRGRSISQEVAALNAVCGAPKATWRPSCRRACVRAVTCSKLDDGEDRP